MNPIPQNDLISILRFYQLAGVDETCQNKPFDHFTAPASTATPLQSDKITLQSKPQITNPPIAAAATIEQARYLTKQITTLDLLRQALIDYQGCPLQQTAKSTCFADGDPTSPLMLIGEAPGRDEDIQGVPFIGHEGKLLNNILNAIGISRDQVYIANVVPWRPPGNRIPSNMEIELCRPFIERQIELASPKILVALGGTAAKFLTGTPQTILKFRGQWSMHKTASAVDIPVMPTLHPNYLLRTPLHKKFVWQDFLQVKQRLHQINQE